MLPAAAKPTVLAAAAAAAAFAAGETRRGAPFWRRGGARGVCGFALPRGAEAPPASHSVQEVPTDERSAATPLRVRVVGGGGRMVLGN